MGTKPTPYQREMLRKRGLNWQDYVLIKNTFTSLYFRNIRTGKLKIILKGERIR